MNPLTPPLKTLYFFNLYVQGRLGFAFDLDIFYAPFQACSFLSYESDYIPNLIRHAYHTQPST